VQTQTVVKKVTTVKSAEEAIRRLLWASSHIEGTVPRTALMTLAQLTAFAHPVGAEKDPGDLHFFSSDLNRLEFMGFIRTGPGGVVELI